MNKNSFIEDNNSILSGVIYSHRMYRVDKWKEIVMKKQIGLMLMLMIAVFAFAACGASKSGTDNTEPETDTAFVDSLKTIGDVIALDKDGFESSVGGGKVVYAFKYDDTYYRVTADMPAETQKAYFDIDVMDDGYKEKQEEILAPLEVTKIENLSEQILTQDELDALTGKTGQEMVNDGWSYEGNVIIGDTEEVQMQYGPFVYNVVFDGSIEGAGTDNSEIEEATKDMKVKSIEFQSLSMTATDNM
jgi:hypothetical protein